MSIQLIITLCILVFLVVMLLTNKLPYGVSAMICCVLFVLFGILDLQTAFSGLSSSTTLMIAPMIVVASALGNPAGSGHLRHYHYPFPADGSDRMYFRYASVSADSG